MNTKLDTAEPEIQHYKGYLGNPLLKRTGIKIEWTEHSVKEYIKCSKDPIYFIETYMKVVHVDRGLIPLKLYDYQKELVLTLHENRQTIICFPRQSGKSTSVVAYLLWYILFNDHIVVALLANKAPTAREILGKAQTAYIHLPKFLQQGVVEWNKGSIVLENGSRAIAESTSSDAIRGFSVNMLILDEVAQIEHWEEFSTSVIPTISSGNSTKIVQLSTPFGLNHFYKTWKEAQNGENGYKPLMIHWGQTPGRDEAWKKTTLKALNNDILKFSQEYECEFLGSSGTLIAGWKLKELTHMRPLTAHDGLTQYFTPIKGHFYTMTADTSEGKGLDYSTFHVIDITTMPYQQSCTFRSNITTPGDFAQIMFTTALAYNNATILVEAESLGPEVSRIIQSDLEYEYILFTESGGPHGKKLSGGFGRGSDAGIKMSPKVKSTGCSLLKLLIEQNQLIINDFHTIEELSRFAKKGKTYQAEVGAHDDLCMALVVFSWLSSQPYFKELTNINTLNRLRDKNDEQVYEELVPFGFYSENSEDEKLGMKVLSTDAAIFGKWLAESPDMTPRQARTVANF